MWEVSEDMALLVGILVGGVLLVGGITQLIIVPTTASARGKDAGIWFLVTAVWLLLFVGLSFWGGLFVGFGLLVTAGGAAEESGVNVVAGLVITLVGLLSVFIEYLPYIALLMTSSRPRRTRRPRRRGRGGAPRRRPRRRPRR